MRQFILGKYAPARAENITAELVFRHIPFKVGYFKDEVFITVFCNSENEFDKLISQLSY